MASVDVEEAAGTLYLVPTPIGDPDDITLRAIEVLRAAAVVAAEDTRKTQTLLRQLDIKARLLSYHDHNEESRAPQLLTMLRGGDDVALVSDAGMPLVNDPGYRVVTAAIAAGIRVCPLPGASATLTALVGSGLPNHRFHYEGFLPRKAAARRAALAALAPITATLIFFEAPHRIVEMLRDMADVLGDRPAALARNLTKADERFLRGRLSELVAELAAEEVVRGQYTVVVGGAPEERTAQEEAYADRLIAAVLGAGGGPRVARDVVKELTDLPRNWVYERVRLAAESPAPPS